MNGYKMRQGTVYRRRADGGKFLLIHHNPMGMESLILPEKAGAFDVASPSLLGIDTLIAMRQSGEFEDTGDLPAEEVAALIGEMIVSGGVTREIAGMLKNVCDELEKR